MKVEVDPDDIKVKSADERGRIYLGSKYADKDKIEIAILDADDAE